MIKGTEYVWLREMKQLCNCVLLLLQKGNLQQVDLMDDTSLF